MNQPTRDDISHLKLLSIFFYLKAGLLALTSVLFLFYIILGGVFMVADIPRKAGDPAPELIGGLFFGVGIVFMAVFLAIAAAVFFAGRSIAKRENYVFVMVVAGILCLSMPLGTILGVFTIIVMLRESVKSMFNGMAPPQFGSTPPDWK